MPLDVYKDWLGIPEGPRPPGHYELLRVVQFEDDEEKIRAHYRKLNAHVRKYASGQYSVQSQDLLNELAKAMLCLTDPIRKREYDESQGRVFEETQDAFGRRPFEDLLVEGKHISREQAKQLESFAEARGLSLRDAAVQMKLVDATTAAQVLAHHLRLPYLELADVIPDDSVLDRVPRNIVKRHSVLPLFVDDDQVLVACADEPGQELEDIFRLRLGMPMRAVIAAPLSINQGIAKYYAAGMRDETVAEAAMAEAARTKQEKKDKKKGRATDAQAVKPAKEKVAAVREPRRRFSQLDEGEQLQRKQLGYIFMCWGSLAGVAIDYFLLRPFLTRMPFPLDSYFLTFISIPLSIWWVLKVYWK